MEVEVYGAIKIKDGLFLGDETAAKDLEFIVTNKVTRIINCSSKQIQNQWDSIGVTYLSYPWNDSDMQIIFDSRDEVFSATYQFIEDNLAQSDSVLVHSVKGQNRSVVIVAGYLMKKFRWSAVKAISFLKSKKPNINLRFNFNNQICALESKLTKMGFGPKTYDWNETSDEKILDSEELLLTNTFLNTKYYNMGENRINNFTLNNHSSKAPKIRWADETNDKTKIKQIIDNDNISKSLNFPLSKKKKTLKSCMKGSNKVIKIQEESNLSSADNEALTLQNSTILNAYKDSAPNDKNINLTNELKSSQKTAKPLEISSKSIATTKRSIQEQKPPEENPQNFKIAATKVNLVQNAPIQKPNQSLQSFFSSSNPKEIAKDRNNVDAIHDTKTVDQKDAKDLKDNQKQKSFKITIKKGSDGAISVNSSSKMSGDSPITNIQAGSMSKLQDASRVLLQANQGSQSLRSVQILKKNNSSATIPLKKFKPESSLGLNKANSSDKKDSRFNFPSFHKSNEMGFSKTQGFFFSGNEELKNEEKNTSFSQSFTTKSFKMRGRTNSPAEKNFTPVFNNFLFHKYDNKPRWKFQLNN